MKGSLDQRKASGRSRNIASALLLGTAAGGGLCSPHTRSLRGGEQERGFKCERSLRLGLYDSVEYLKSSGLIADRKDLLNHHFVGYIEDLLFSSELDYLPVLGKNISARFKKRQPHCSVTSLPI
jgi:hypothetical protein